MTHHAWLVTRLTQAITRLGADRPLTWRACHAVRDLLAADGASITLKCSGPAWVTVCSTDKIAELLENLQDVLGEGPCRDAFDSGRPVETLIDEMAAARWPQFIPAAGNVVGHDGVLWSLPMRSAGKLIGAISLYRRVRGTLLLPAGTAQVLADAVAGELLTDPDVFAMFTGLREGSGWWPRAVVQQAAGLIAGQFGVSVSDALAVLRSRAFAADVQLRDIAKQVVDRKLDLSEDWP